MHYPAGYPGTSIRVQYNLLNMIYLYKKVCTCTYVYPARVLSQGNNIYLYIHALGGTDTPSQYRYCTRTRTLVRRALFYVYSWHAQFYASPTLIFVLEPPVSYSLVGCSLDIDLDLSPVQQFKANIELNNPPEFESTFVVMDSVFVCV